MSPPPGADETPTATTTATVLATHNRGDANESVTLGPNGENLQPAPALLDAVKQQGLGGSHEAP
jgi:hypothetical protein